MIFQRRPICGLVRSSLPNPVEGRVFFSIKPPEKQDIDPESGLGLRFSVFPHWNWVMTSLSRLILFIGVVGASRYCGDPGKQGHS